jgi:geranylgeranyl pyrophosphate synthase
MLHGVEREQFADVLQNFGDDRWEELVELLASAGSFDYANQLIENHVDRALQHLEKLGSNSATKLMAEVAKRSRTRKI